MEDEKLSENQNESTNDNAKSSDIEKAQKKSAKKTTKAHTKFLDFLESVQTSKKSLIFLTIGIIFIMGVLALGIFLVTVKGSEEVMVPDVVGKELTDALLDMQIKELYPKIQLRYSNSPEEKGCVIEQNPTAGAIVKAGRRIELVISRGAVIDKVEDYVGQKLDDVRIHLQTIFASSDKALVTLDEKILYEYNEAEQGTILAQEPSAGTELTDEGVKLKLVVSRGAEHEKVKVPNIVGLTINDVLLQMSRSKVVFDFSPMITDDFEQNGKVISQGMESDIYVNTYTRIPAVLAYSANKNPKMIYGIFETELPHYPYALQVQLDALTPDGERFNVITMMHPGGKLTIPYAVSARTELILSVFNKETVRYTVR